MPRKYILLALIALLVAVLLPSAPPLSFPSDSIIIVKEGVDLSTVAKNLERDRVIQSPFWFRIFVIALRGERDMKAGEYYLPHPQGSFLIAWRILRGDHDIETVKITIPEGFTNEEITSLFDNRFIYFNKAEFETRAPQGYLFPDTYFVPITTTASSSIKMFQDNFSRQTSQIAVDKEIIIMASLLEAEAKTKEDREMVSDILWKRLKLGMPLQVDAYMWTYEFKGLPEKPINNPGLISIEAAIHPTSTPYLYFLTGDNSKMYYSRTFDEHVAQKQKYIKNP